MMKKDAAAALVVIIIVIASISTNVSWKELFPNILMGCSKCVKGNYGTDPSFFLSARFRIAIIGSSGYIESRLMNHLSKEKTWTVIGYC
jgi:hypothetical protein